MTTIVENKNTETQASPIVETKELTMWEAFSKAQAEADSAIKNKENSHLKYNYADINSYIELIKLNYNRLGFSVIQLNNQQFLDNGNCVLNITTKVIYKTGEVAIDYTSSHPMTNADLANPQRVGSFITYYRKYAMQCIFCLSAEDNDAQDLDSLKSKKSKLEDIYSKNLKTKLSPAQINFINQEIAKCANFPMESFNQYLLSKYKNTLENIEVDGSDFKNIVGLIQAKQISN